MRKGVTAAVVDPGDARPVLDVLEQEGLSLSAILITHHHADHQGGVAELLAHHSAEVFGPAAESIASISRPLRSGDTISIAPCDIEFQVIAVYCAHEYTQANLRFALAVEPGNRRLLSRVEEVAVTRARGGATLPSTIAIEKATNPFLRCREPEVAAAARGRVPAARDEVAVFAALREWKNSF